jgi:hypothetical protein
MRTLGSDTRQSYSVDRAVRRELVVACEQALEEGWGWKEAAYEARKKILI